MNKFSDRQKIAGLSPKIYQRWKKEDELEITNKRMNKMEEELQKLINFHEEIKKELENE